MTNKIFITAEFCCNHMGDISIAKEMIDTLAVQDDKIDIIKFQKRTPKLILSKEQYAAPHPDSKNSYGKTYGEHREFLELSIEEHRQLKQYLEEKGFIYSSSVFDKNSLEEILSLNPRIIKFGASNNTDTKLIKYLTEHYDGEIHISMGCITRDEERQIIKAIEKKIGNVVLYACTSAYPTPVGNICLLEISRIKQEYGNAIKAIGFSGHHIGIYQDIAALALGATYFERHFTLNKSFKGTDHKISLEVSELNELVRAIRTVNKDLIYKPDSYLKCEEYVRETMKQINLLEE